MTGICWVLSCRGPLLLCRHYWGWYQWTDLPGPCAHSFSTGKHLTYGPYTQPSGGGWPDRRLSSLTIGWSWATVSGFSLLSWLVYDIDISFRWRIRGGSFSGNACLSPSTLGWRLAISWIYTVRFGGLSMERGQWLFSLHLESLSRTAIFALSTNCRRVPRRPAVSPLTVSIWNNWYEPQSEWCGKRCGTKASCLQDINIINLTFRKMGVPLEHLI